MVIIYTVLLYLFHVILFIITRYYWGPT